MRAPELLTCPFCGSNDVDNKRADARYHCYRCGADGPQIPYAPDDKAWTWQTRATQPDPRDEVIRALMESLETIASNQCCDAEPWYIAYAALAAAKAVAK